MKGTAYAVGGRCNYCLQSGEVRRRRAFGKKKKKEKQKESTMTSAQTVINILRLITTQASMQRLNGLPVVGIVIFLSGYAVNSSTRILAQLPFSLHHLSVPSRPLLPHTRHPSVTYPTCYRRFHPPLCISCEIMYSFKIDNRRQRTDLCKRRLRQYSRE